MLNNPDYFIKNDSDISIMATGSISLNYSKISIEEGGTFKLTATVTGSGGTLAWSSSDPCATVDNNGNVMGVKSGSTTIEQTGG